MTFARNLLRAGMRATSTLTRMGAAAQEQLRGASAVDSRPTNHGVARCMDSILERMRGKQSKCLAIRPPGGHIFQCVPLIGLGARMAACWRPGELPSGGAAVEVTKGLPVCVTGARGSPRLSRVDGELIASLAISQRWLGSHISDPHFHMRTRGTHAYHAFPAARATRTPSPAYACGGCHQRVSS